MIFLIKGGILIPSSNKTLNLNLNKWLGADKPKKDDFNNDNQKIDEACGLLSQSMEDLKNAKLQQEQQNGTYDASIQSLTAHTKDSGIHTAAAEKAAWNAKVDTSTLTAHTNDKVVHITATERATWNTSSGFMTGYYDGNGELSRTFNIGFKPKFAIIFPIDNPIVNFAVVGEQIQVSSGFISQSGCSRGLELATAGFTVTNSAMGGVDGTTLRYNSSGVRYIYFCWKSV